MRRADEHRAKTEEHRTGKAVDSMALAFERVTKQHAHHALLRVLCDAIVVIYRTQQHQRVDDHLVRDRHDLQ